LAAIPRLIARRSAISVFLSPSAANNTIRERSASACALVRRRAQLSKRARSSSLNSTATATGEGMNPLYPLPAN
jgi:hypothetical protein